MRSSLCIVYLFAVIACHHPTDLDNQTPSDKAMVVDSVSPQMIEAAPQVTFDYDTSQWSEIMASEDVLLDLRYATNNNFSDRQLYPCGRCFLRPPVAHALQRAIQAAKVQQRKIILFDCYRPLAIQKSLWEQFPNPSYVTPPSKGSMHNRGLAVDISLADSSGMYLDMGTTYDYFGREAHTDYRHPDAQVEANRSMLQALLTPVGFKGIRTEWWHFSMPSVSAPIADTLWNCQ